MDSKEEMAAAKLLARLKLNGFSIFAQYEYLGSMEIFRGIIISPAGDDAKRSLENIIDIITSKKGLARKVNN